MLKYFISKNNQLIFHPVNTSFHKYVYRRCHFFIIKVILFQIITPEKVRLPLNK